MNNKNSTLIPMIILGVLFFIFGFVTWLNGSLIPFLKIICDLNEFQALFVTFSFYIAYTVMALPMSYVLNITGYKNGMALGLAIMAIGSLLFIPASLTANFFAFLIALFTLGTGLTILQTASNPYVVFLGSQESAAMRISIMGLINKGAGVFAPLIFTALILSDLSSFSTNSLTQMQIEELTTRLIYPYIIMSLILISLIALVKLSPLPDLEIEKSKEEKVNIFAFKHLVLGAIALFFYVGVEVIAGDTIGLYGQSLHVDNYTSLTSYTMSFMILGYLIGVIFIPKYLSQEKALLGSAISGVIFSTALLFSSQESHSISEILWGWSTIATLPNSITLLALLGLSNPLVWPTIWPLALKGLGKHTAQGSAILIMAIAGGAILPLLFGKSAEILGNIQSAYIITIPAYLFIFFYAIKGHKI